MCKNCKVRKQRLIARYLGRMSIAPIAGIAVYINSANIKHGIVTFLLIAAVTIFFHVVDPPPDNYTL